MAKLRGKEKHLKRLWALSGPAVTKLAGAIVYEGADTIRAEAFRAVSAGSVSGKGHVASAPGEAPMRDTGTLQAGFETQQTGPVTAEFRAEASYSAALEFGTSKMAARPFVRPARDKMAPAIRKRFAEQIDKLIKRSG